MWKPIDLKETGILFVTVLCSRGAVRLSAAGLCLMCTLAAAQNDPTVKVSGGMIRGTLMTEGGAVFKAIPYAQPPTRKLRWREPMPVKAWAGIRDGTQFGAICPQNPSASIPNAAAISSEDCLFLNVWTPEWPVRGRRSVLLWIPGGGNINGGTWEPRHDGSHLARRGVVVVTDNYRLGSFGFFSHPALTRESPHKASGNQGLLDQVAALEWVHANIARFGGDPDEITLAGVSAGGIDISALMTSPLTAGRFKRAIVQSGPSRNAIGDPLPLPRAEQQGLAHTTTWGAPPGASLDVLRSIPMDQILKAQPLRPVAHLNLSVDGYVIPRVPAEVFAGGGQHKVPVIIGNSARDFTPGAAPPTNLDTLIAQTYGPLASRARPLYGAADPLYGTPEVQWATDVSFRCGAVMQLVQHVAAGNTAFGYEFARLATPDFQPGGNIHGLDGGYVFGTFAIRAQGTTLTPISLTAADTALSDQMQQYWANFVKTGNPNGTGLLPWPPFSDPTRAYLEFLTAGPVAKEGLRRTQCDLFIENVYRLYPKP